jgi:hypothetical protein
MPVTAARNRAIQVRSGAISQHGAVTTACSAMMSAMAIGAGNG